MKIAGNSQVSKEYFAEEIRYTEEHFKAFYSCGAPDGSPEKEALRSALIEARRQFYNIWSVVHHAPPSILEQEHLL